MIALEVGICSFFSDLVAAWVASNNKLKNMASSTHRLTIGFLLSLPCSQHHEITIKGILGMIEI